jgi:hypothetical protein
MKDIASHVERKIHCVPWKYEKKFVNIFWHKKQLIIFYTKDGGFQASIFIFIFFIPSYWRWLNKSYSKKAIVI